LISEMTPRRRSRSQSLGTCGIPLLAGAVLIGIIVLFAGMNVKSPAFGGDFPFEEIAKVSIAGSTEGLIGNGPIAIKTHPAVGSLDSDHFSKLELVDESLVLKVLNEKSLPIVCT
jgi:hypothetical protein